MSMNDGGKAFPVPMIPIDRNGGYTEVRHEGMSLRDWFAGQALVGLLSQVDNEGGKDQVRPVYEGQFLKGLDEDDDSFYVARDAYLIADAMLERKEMGKA